MLNGHGEQIMMNASDADESVEEGDDVEVLPICEQERRTYCDDPNAEYDV